MSTVFTNAGQTRINELTGLEQNLKIDRMVFALIPGLDPAAAIDRAQGMPDAGYIVHTAIIDPAHKGYVDPDQVVYSVILGSDLGDWSFNWIGLIEEATDTIIAITTLPDTPKRKSDIATNTTGNTITRNFMIQFQDAQNLTGITVAAETWQFNWQAEWTAHANLLVNPTQAGNVGKHVTDSQAKKWEDHADFQHTIGGLPIGPNVAFDSCAAPDWAGDPVDWNLVTKAGPWMCAGGGDINGPGWTSQIYVMGVNNNNYIRQVAYRLWDHDIKTRYSRDGGQTWVPWCSTSQTVGKIDLLPFRYNQLPSGWYFANGDTVLLTSDAGQVLALLSANFKADWGITDDGTNINLPNLFYSDGRGLFLRAVDGSTEQVGRIELDEIISHAHNIPLNRSGGWDACYNQDPQSSGSATNCSSSRDTGTIGGTETRPINTGMTPAIFLGV